jgi:hypothetical protein
MDSGFRGPTEMKQPTMYGPGGTPNGLAAKVSPKTSPKVPPRIVTSPNMFSRRSIQPEDIGLAVSPDNVMPMDSQYTRKRSSKLLPEKPSLGVSIPQQETERSVRRTWIPQPPQSRQANVQRESGATQFEEDLATPYNGGTRSSNGIQHKGFINQGNGAGNFGNNSGPTKLLAIPPSLYIKPLNINRPTGSFSQPRGPPTAISSIYSAQPPSSAHLSNTSSMINRPRKSYKQYHPYQNERESAGSFTSFESMDSHLDVPEPKTAELSPVVESPSRSSVSYSKVPNSGIGRLPAETIRLVPPPKQPDFATAVAREREAKPWREAELRAAQERSQPVQRDHAAPSAVFNQLWTDARYQNKSQPPLPLNPPTRPLDPSTDVRTSNTPSMASTSTTSSLLAKRRGDRKAAALTLGTDEKARQARWRVLRNEDMEAAKSPSWRPQAGRGMGELPGTPGWKPRLTPTRRGDDLFISVQ